MAAVSRVPLIAGNWKMNLDHLQAIAFVQKLAWTLKDAGHDYRETEVAIFPPFTDLRSVQTLISADKYELALGGQDLSQHDSGAYTGRSPARSSPLSRRSTCSSVTPSGASTTARPTRSSGPRSWPLCATASSR
ncbi:hypothetical protein GCM10025866_29360 [Naasia aerilata]|uniref:Triosephosphate isomerase n=1 Tax=Naasia aerilata TaxID=1162966 RepID=A0ABN6XSX4_9MICO|nr:hypothetical protein GCM10025866_29360 [Naasia aerilata]